MRTINKKIYMKPPHHLFNVDEMGHTVIQYPQKHVAQRAKQHVGPIILCERGQSGTGMWTTSANGVFISPMSDSLANGVPVCTIFSYHAKLRKQTPDGQSSILFKAIYS